MLIAGDFLWPFTPGEEPDLILGLHQVQVSSTYQLPVTPVAFVLDEVAQYNKKRFVWPTQSRTAGTQILGLPFTGEVAPGTQLPEFSAFGCRARMPIAWALKMSFFLYRV